MSSKLWSRLTYSLPLTYIDQNLPQGSAVYLTDSFEEGIRLRHEYFVHPTPGLLSWGINGP